MPNPRLAARYAKSLIDISKEQNNLEAVLADMGTIKNAIQESRDLDNMLKSPIVNVDKKHNVIQAIFNGKVTPLTSSFLKLVVHKRRESNLAEMATAFQQQYNEMHNIKEVFVTTAVKMTPEISTKVNEKIASFLPNTKVDIVSQIDESIIGGFIIKIDDKLYDASVKRELNDIKQQFTSNIYTPTI